MPCSNARGMVSRCVYRLIFWRPASPSLPNSSSAGMTGCSNCKTICAVMYGYTPMAMTEKFCMAPPENMSNIPSNWFWANTWRSASTSTPGTGMCAKSR